MRSYAKFTSSHSRNSVNKAFAVFFVLLACVALAGAQASYTITDLGTLGGGASSGNGINKFGQVAGQASTTSNTHAFLYGSGAMKDLGSLGGPYSLGKALNNLGQVTGQSSTTNTSSNANHAFLYSAGAMTDLGTLGGSYSIGNGVNDSGQVVGSSSLPGSYHQHAFLYSAGTMTDLKTLGGTDSFGLGINNLGQVAGYASTSRGLSHAFLYSGGQMTDLGTLGGSSSAGYGINNSGQVTGYSYIGKGSNYYHAFLYSAGAMTDLGALAGNYSVGYAVNSAGQVTGVASIAGGAYHAFLYTPGKGMVDLNSLIPSDSGWILTTGWGINDAGQIAGQGTINGKNHGFLLTPQNPPTTVAMASPAPNAAGWNKTNVIITLHSTPNGGPDVKQITYSTTGAQSIASTTVAGTNATISITNEGTTKVSFFATDDAGSVEAIKTITLKIDKTPPAIVPAQTPLPNSYGWNNTSVTASFSCSDALSGLAAGSPPQDTVISNQGAGQSVIGTCYDVAGNSASAVVKVNIDWTPPTVACSATPNLLWPPNHKLVNIKTTVKVTDSLSGAARFQLLSVTSNEPDSGLGDIVGWTLNAPSTSGQLRAERLGTGTGRIYTFVYQGFDKAGNSASCSTSVFVPHDRGHK